MMIEQELRTLSMSKITKLSVGFVKLDVSLKNNTSVEDREFISKLFDMMEQFENSHPEDETNPPAKEA
jgi:hypothetical protein